MMVKGIAATPVNQPDVGISSGFTIKVVGFTWMQQHIGNSSNRDNCFNPVFTLWESHPLEPFYRDTNAANGTVSVADASPRQTDLPKHGS